MEGEQHPFDRINFKKEHIRNIYGESHPEYDYICLINPFHSRHNLDFSCVDNSKETYGSFCYAISSNKFDIENNTISSISWPLKNFEKWLYLFSGKIDYNQNEDAPTVVFTPIPLKSWETTLGRLHLERYWHCPYSMPSTKTCIEEKYYLTLNFSKKQNIEYCLDLSRKVSQFFLTCISNHIQLSNPIIKTNTNKNIKIRINKRILSQENQNLHQFIFPLKTLEDDFGSVIESYINLYDKYLGGFYLFPSSLIKGLFVEHKFSNLVCGLESLHTNYFGKNYNVNEEKIKHIQQELKNISSLNCRDRKRIIHSIKYSMSPNLQSRLYDFFKCIYDNYNEEKLNELLNEIVNIRNKIMHYGGPQNIGDAYSVQRIALLNLSLAPIYICSVLWIIGIKKELIKNIFLNSPALFEGRVLLEQYGVLKR